MLATKISSLVVSGTSMFRGELLYEQPISHEEMLCMSKWSVSHSTVMTILPSLQVINPCVKIIKVLMMYLSNLPCDGPNWHIVAIDNSEEQSAETKHYYGSQSDNNTL